MKEKSQIEDIDRSVYDIRDEEHDAYRMESGLTPEIIDKLSKEKNDPVWMQQFRLQSLQIYNEMKVPNWGPSLDGLDIANIATYVRPNTKMQNNWKNVPKDIKDTFERLGIPKAERNSLAGGCVFRYGECHERRVCRYGKKIFYEACNSARP